MRTYTVTSELRTSLWMKILRFFWLKKKREEFTLDIDEGAGFRVGDTLQCQEVNGTINKLKIIK